MVKMKRHGQRSQHVLLIGCMLLQVALCSLASAQEGIHIRLDQHGRGVLQEDAEVDGIDDDPAGAGDALGALGQRASLGGRVGQRAWVRKAGARRARLRGMGHKVLSVEELSTGHGPNGKCAPGCTRHGVCNEELGRCDCPRGWGGVDCSEPPTDMYRICKETHFHHYKENCTDVGAIPPKVLPIVCINKCNGRGWCRAGWCHCKAGYWGADCSLSMGPDGKVEVLAGMGYKPRKKKPLVYVYDLPPRIGTWRNPHFTDRPLHVVFWHRLLGAGAITADASKADYFFFPVSVRGPSEGLLLEAAVDYVRTHWPYWNQTQGARHVIIHTGDTGRAELTGRTKTITANCTFLTHWGLYQDYPFSGWPASHVPDRDIVLPIYIQPKGGRAAGLQMSPHHPKSNFRFADNKDIQLLFAGRICGGREEPDGNKVPNCRPLSKGYSQGVRQEVHQHHWNRTGFRIAVSNPTYFNDLMRTRFCLAPTGGGHGHRQILVAFSGCTPLIISDYVLQPFEPALNWTRFGLTLPQSEIPNLHKILPAVSDQQFKEMQAALPCAAQHFTWSTGGGSFMHEDGKYDAFETTMEVLRMMVKYPGVPHADFEARDPEFKAFMECRSDAYYAAHKGATDTVPLNPKLASNSSIIDVSGNALCSMSKWDGVPVPCEKCLITYKRLPPGGALCCDHVLNLGQCPRLWA